MSIFVSSNGTRVNIHAPYEYNDVRYPNLTNPQDREVIGISELPEPLAPEDYSEKFYYRTEQDTFPYVVYTKKSEEQIQQIQRDELLNKIDSLEREYMLPRPTREFMLLQMEALAASQGIDPMDNIGYARVKEFDNQIRDLRTQADALKLQQ